MYFQASRQSSKMTTTTTLFDPLLGGFPKTTSSPNNNNNNSLSDDDSSSILNLLREMSEDINRFAVDNSKHDENDNEFAMVDSGSKIVFDPDWIKKEEEDIVMEFDAADLVSPLRSAMMAEVEAPSEHKLEQAVLNGGTVLAVSPHAIVEKKIESDHVTEKCVQSRTDHCGICRLVFSDAAALKAHTDSHAKLCRCCQCGKAFSSHSRLLAHHRKHSKEKPFQCGSCGKHYATRTTLSRHQLHYCQTLRAKCEDIGFPGGDSNLLLDSSSSEG